MRLDLTPDEVDLLARLCSGCDDAEAKTRDLAQRIERYLRRRLEAENRDAQTPSGPYHPSIQCLRCLQFLQDRSVHYCPSHPRGP